MLKEASPCSDCQKHYRFFAMDYDHVRGEKIANIEQIIRRGITHFPALKAEIDKCDLVCATCHRIRTHTRRKKNSPPN